MDERIEEVETTSMQLERVSVNGLSLGISRQGEWKDPRQTLVLLHGFTGSSASWAGILPRLISPGRRLLTVDLPGHGVADAPADPERYSIEHCQSDLLALFQRLDIQAGQAILLGYSMGGRVALYTALSGYLRGLILESASPGLASAEERAQRRQSDAALAERIEKQGLAVFVAEWENLPLFASQQSLPPEQRAALREQRLQNRPTGLANSLRGLGTGSQPALHERLADLALPALLLVGELDGKYCQIAREMALRLPRAEVRIVPGAGHTIHLEQPALFAAFVNAFCDALC